MPFQDFREVFDEIEVGFVCIANEQFLFAILTILLFFESQQVDAANIIRCGTCFLDCEQLVCFVFALHILDCKCICIAESIFVVGVQLCIVRVGLHPFDSSAPCIHIA
jgi:hypothetical protein